MEVQEVSRRLYKVVKVVEDSRRLKKAQVQRLPEVQEGKRKVPNGSTWFKKL